MNYIKYSKIVWMSESSESPCASFEERLTALHLASLEFIQDTSIDALLERIAEIARQQTGARYAAVGVLDDNGKLEHFIPVGMRPEEIKKIKHRPSGKGLIGLLMRGDATIRIPDILSDPRSYGFPRLHPIMGSFLGVPIRQGTRNLGQIYLTDKQGEKEFSALDQQVIETLAGYAAIAISNARLFSDLARRDQVLTRRNENLTLLNELAFTLSSFTDIDQMLEDVLSKVIKHVNLEAGEIFLLLESSRMLKLMIHQGDGLKRIWKQRQFQFGEGTVGMTALTGRPVQVELHRSNDQNLDPAVLDGHFHLLGCFPLSGRGGSQGVLCTVSVQSHIPDEVDLHFLAVVSSWVGTVIENSRLNMQQRRIAVLEERERIGMDLHDGIIQSIYAVGLTLEHARLLMEDDAAKSSQRIEQAISDLNKTIRDIRSYILDLRPRQLHDENLMAGIQRLVNEFRVNTLVEVNLRGIREDVQDLPEAQALALFLICQEALANVAKHAHARHVEVNLWTSPDRVLLEVRDDGRGFEPQKTHLTLGHGLQNIQTRAHNAGGDVELSSEPGDGTSILAWVPFVRGSSQVSEGAVEEPPPVKTQKFE